MPMKLLLMILCPLAVIGAITVILWIMTLFETPTNYNHWDSE